MTRAALLVACALGSVACGGVALPTRSAAERPDQSAELAAKVRDLQRQAAVAEVEIERLKRQVAELEARLGGRSAPARPPATGGTGGAGAAGTSRPAPPTTAPRGQIPAVADEPAPRREPAFEVEDIDPPTRREPVVRPLPGSPSPSTPEPAGDAPVPTAAQAIYDRGYTEYHQGRYLDAEASFQRFLQAYANTELADNAQYWIGESRLARGDQRGALAAFRETVERYPRGNKVPDALLKVGESLRELGDAESARAAYQEVVRRFPGSAAAAVAEERLRADR